MNDLLIRGRLRDENIAVCVAITTQLCREAQRLHDLGSTSAIALGRLLTAAALTGLIHERPGSLSLQVVSNGRLRQIYADVTKEGALRGYVKPADLAMPTLADESATGRRAIAHAVGEGLLSAIRFADNEPYTQSSAEIVSGEIDRDVEHFLGTSDQVASALITDVLLVDDDQVATAGGVLVQAMPGAAAARVNALRTSLQSGVFTRELARTAGAAQLLTTLFPQVERLEPSTAIHWQCRCSMERVFSSIKMLEPADLADLVNRNSRVAVTCDFCRKSYDVEPEQIREAYNATIRGSG